MSEVITVEAVSDKYKNKYSAGSVKANGKWMQVSSKLDLGLFQKDTQLNVETKTNDKGYTSIVGIVPTATIEAAQVAEKPKRAKKAEVGETRTFEDIPKVTSYEDNKNRRIQVQGIIQHCVASPATINFGNEPDEIATKVLALADLLIAGMDERV